MWFLRSSLGMKSFTLFCIITFVSWESLTHISVSLSFLIDEMVCSCDVIVSVSFKASDRILLFKLKVTDEAVKQLFCVRHLLQSREKAWLTRFRKNFFLCGSHEWVVSNLRDTYTRFWVCIQNFTDEVLAFWRKKLWHLIICTHDFLIKVRCLRIFEG